MRVNIHMEDLQGHTEYVVTRSRQDGKLYMGLRYYISNVPQPKSNHQITDQTPAITLWTEKEEQDTETLIPRELITLAKLENEINEFITKRTTTPVGTA